MSRYCFSRRALICAACFMFLTGVSIAVFAAKKYLGPGKDRWPIKTELKKGKVGDKAKLITVEKMRNLDVPDPQTLTAAHLQDKLLPAELTGGFHEGDIVKMDGYIQLVAMESTCSSGPCTKSHPYSDADYHLQVTDKYELRDSNIVVEVPNPQFVRDPALKAKVEALREKLKTKLIPDATEFGTNCMVHPPHVTITGQLFIDAFHAIHNPNEPGGGRGKQKHKSATVWEIHPVYDINFLDKKPTRKAAQSCPTGGSQNTDWVIVD
jgi:hypothetical protein